MRSLLPYLVVLGAVAWADGAAAHPLPFDCVVRPDEPEVTPDATFGAFGGLLVSSSKLGVAPGPGAAFRVKTRGDHAFVSGARGGGAFSKEGSFGVVGLDVGYRGNFRPGTCLKAGLLAFVQSQIWAGDIPNDILYLGGAVGPFAQLTFLEIHVPIGVGFGTSLRDPFQGSDRDVGVAFNTSVMLGVVF